MPNILPTISLPTNSPSIQHDDNNAEEDVSNGGSCISSVVGVNYNYNLRTCNNPQNSFEAEIRPDKSVSLMFDRIGLSYKQSSLAYLTIIKSLGYDPAAAVCSASTMFRARKSFRENEALDIRMNFDPKSMKTVHFDAKTYIKRGNQRDKRVAVVLSDRNEAKLLEIVNVPLGTGQAHAQVVFEALQKWNLQDKIHSVCFDTEPVNTGNHTGSVRLLEERLSRSLLRLACRHHIFEIILSEVFATVVEKRESVQSPTIKLFEYYCQEYFKAEFQPREYTSGRNDPLFQRLVGTEEMERIEIFCKSQLLKYNPRSDYKEVLVLTLLLVSAQGTYPYKIQAPGSYSRARFMNKIIYCIKIYLFRDQLDIGIDIMISIRRFLAFVMKIYLEKWFTCTQAIEAPKNDLDMLKSICDLDESMPIGNAFQKLTSHLWYLSEHLVALAFFDSRVSILEKVRMVQRTMNEPVDGDDPNRAKIQHDLDHEHIEALNISHFVTKRTLNFFKITGIDSSFLNQHPRLWENNKIYQKARKSVESLPVVNDAAERSIALYQQYKDKACGEEQRENLLQVVERERQKFKKLRKQDIVQALH